MLLFMFLDQKHFEFEHKFNAVAVVADSSWRQGSLRPPPPSRSYKTGQRRDCHQRRPLNFHLFICWPPVSRYAIGSTKMACTLRMEVLPFTGDSRRHLID